MSLISKLPLAQDCLCNHSLASVHFYFFTTLLVRVVTKDPLQANSFVNFVLLQITLLKPTTLFPAIHNCVTNCTIPDLEQWMIGRKIKSECLRMATLGGIRSCVSRTLCARVLNLLHQWHCLTLLDWGQLKTAFNICLAVICSLFFFKMYLNKL